MNANTDTRIRILGIAPYEGLKYIMKQVAGKRDDILLDVYVGNLAAGADLAAHHQHDYDLIISRGGTADMIRECTNIPVIDISLSVYDILRAIKLSENYADRFAMIGFPKITSNAHTICELLQYKFDIFTIHSEAEASSMMDTLKERGYHMVLCDMITSHLAQQAGLNAILITSGLESISAAFDHAAEVYQSIHAVHAENLFLHDLLLGVNEKTIVFTEDGSIHFISYEVSEFPDLPQLLSDDIKRVMEKGDCKFFKSLGDTLYAFTGRRIQNGQEALAAFYFASTSVPFARSKYEIQYSTQQEVHDAFFNSFYNVVSSNTPLSTAIRKVGQSTVPVMLLGEPGSGKEQAARTIYSNSTFSSNPLIIIDCTLLSEKSWNFLTNHYNSPFNDNDNTIFIKNIPALSQDRQQHLLSLIIDTNMSKRNRLIFSCDVLPGGELPAMCVRFVNMLSCVTMRLPSLRDHLGELPTLASLYLSMLNMDLPNQIIGFEPDAIKLLQSYDWPYNYTQFKRILHELALITTTSYISGKDVSSILSKEMSANQVNTASVLSSAPADAPSLNLASTLADIDRQIIHLVLEKNGGNQTAAAKQLGIGRSTLWRYLKD